MKTAILVLAVFLTSITRLSIAGDLTYPTTEKDIVAALTLKDGKAEVAGIEYVSEKGKVYKIIDGKRYRMRGMAGIVDTDLVPRAGALVRFDFNSAMIRHESFGLLDNYASALKGDLSDAKLQVGGHTDSIGSSERNQALSRERAESVRQYLVKHGIEEDRLMISAFGATKPVESNNTDNGRAKNRRVEFIRVE